MEAKDVDAILDQIRTRGGRVTPVTRRVVEMAVKHPAAHFRSSDFVRNANEFEPITESTVYRTLDRLVAYGVLERFQLGAGPARFHLGPHRHDHLVCERCGRVIDAPAGLLDEVARKIRTDYDFVLGIGISSLNGTCTACRKIIRDAEEQSPPPA